MLAEKRYLAVSIDLTVSSSSIFRAVSSEGAQKIFGLETWRVIGCSYVYEPLPPGVLEKLQELNPVTEKGWRATQNHRFLTDTGNVHLDRQITSTVTIMALSDDKEQFKRKFDRVHSIKLPEKKAPLRLKAEKTSSLPLFPTLDATPKAK